MSSQTFILGAGLTGLVTAFKLKLAGKPFLLFEQADRVGGVIRTTTEGAFTFEGGPNSGVVGNTAVVELFDQLADRCQIEMASDAVKKRYVLKGGQWRALPSGLLSAVGTPLFSWADKFRILAEPFRARGTEPNESLADLVRRRLGQSFLDYAVDPFVLGIYAGDPNRLVPKYALPKLYQLEQNYGSFIRGAIAKAREPKTELEKRVTRQVFSVRGGLQRLTDALFQAIGPENVVLQATDLRVLPVADGFELHYQQGGQEQVRSGKNVITTTGAYTLPSLLPFVDAATMQPIAALEHTQVAELQIGFEQWTGRPLDAFGGLIPFKEQRRILGVLFMSAMVTGRAPAGGALFTVFVGGVRRSELLQQTDEDLKAMVLEEFAQLMDYPHPPQMVHVQRYAKAIPQYYADTAQRLAACQQIEQRYPGLYIGGNLRDGIGMADRIQQATLLAAKIGS